MDLSANNNYISDEFKKHLEILCTQNSFIANDLNKLFKKKNVKSFRVLESLTILLLNKKCYADLLEWVPNLIPELVYRGLEHIKTNENQNVNMKYLEILFHVVQYRPDLYLMISEALLQLDILRNSNELMDVDGEPLQKKKKLFLNSISKKFLLSFLIFMKKNPNLFKNYCGPFVKILQSNDSAIKGIAFEIFYEIFGFSSLLRYKMHNKQPNLKAKTLIQLDIQEENNYSTPLYSIRNNMIMSTKCFKMTSIGNVFLKPGKSNKQTNFDLFNDFIVTPDLKNICRLIALSIIENKPVLLKGGIGTGKTAIIEFIAKQTNRIDAPNFVSIQLSEQTDSKSLLGTYRCTPVPGQFEWCDGLLTTAVVNGYWLLLEDIEKASDDLISLITPLITGSSISIPGHRNNMETHADFRLFATCHSSGNVLLQNQNWNIVSMPEINENQLDLILQAKYSGLRSLIKKLLDIYFALFKSGEKFRPISMRDLFKFANRLKEYIINSDEAVNEDIIMRILQDASDIFVMSCPIIKKRINMLTLVGSYFNVNETKCNYLLSNYRAEISWLDDGEKFKTGRIISSVNISLKCFTDIQCNLAKTRSSSNLLEFLSCCVKNEEPVLLVGETGTGKTSCVQYLSNNVGKNLKVINMNQYTDCTDLLGGFKPIGAKILVNPLREKFHQIFRSYFDELKNKTFLEKINNCVRNEKWKVLLDSMEKIVTIAITRWKTDDWVSLKNNILEIREQLKNGANKLVFSFIKGSLIEALENGDWILLDEINLAPPDTLDGLSALLDPKGSLTLLEKGDNMPIKRHKDFRVFACMNPATDVGKKQLSLGIRNRFTEFFVDELTDTNELLALVSFYLEKSSVNIKLIHSVVDLYKTLRCKAELDLEDGTGRKPHYSLRTLCRALKYSTNQKSSNFSYCLYEAFCLSFMTCLNRQSEEKVEGLIRSAFGGKSNLNSFERPGFDYIQIHGYWIMKGGCKYKMDDDDYIRTPTVDWNLKNLARAASACTLPILIQGETSVGKTSLIKYLAKLTGNRIVRINNHEHTDMQEYIGCYSTDSVDGRLAYKDGVLVDAMRKGYWIILDELNLAPSDVLEALNRVLDDNRELLITETKEMVSANPKFMLFATQNPAGGQYGGRKELSKAFRNRFIELHFDALPRTELVQIVHKRCAIPESYALKLVDVMRDLQVWRRKSGVFAGREGFITLRDLFRWANRYRLTTFCDKEYVDWKQFLAEQGFMLLAGRVRCSDEVEIVRKVIEKHFTKTSVDTKQLFSMEKISELKRASECQNSNYNHLVWTNGLRRQAILIHEALKFGEPILLVGQTGCGKTTLVEFFAEFKKTNFYSVSCHRQTEVSDILGSLRPIRDHSSDNENRLFEWLDGPLVKAMKDGGLLLLDEISLADDSVIERLNSVLELERSLLIAEKGQVEEIQANPTFCLAATMNPGGDFGKKELSPALRNRFTEIWCWGVEDDEDYIKIIRHNSINRNKNKTFPNEMVEFVNWLKGNQQLSIKDGVSIRDYLNWIEFINRTSKFLTPSVSHIHGALTSFVDSIGTGSTTTAFSENSIRIEANNVLKTLFCKNDNIPDELHDWTIDFSSSEKFVTFGPFFIEKGSHFNPNRPVSFNFDAPTTKSNLLKIFRALVLDRPVLLEGSPGVGKTSIVLELAKASGWCVTRINLSEQTDVSDLFGADLPVEGDSCGGKFQWRDGPLLQALKSGSWIVLDELNLASQSVLEGLNAILDHRGEIYIPELDKTFKIQIRKTRLFACQNPYIQGADRKGLPQSFLNRFIKIFTEILSRNDLIEIINNAFPQLTVWSENMIDFNMAVSSHFKLLWEFNLRDVFRWCELIDSANLSFKHPSYFVRTIYACRMRNEEDCNKVIDIYNEIFLNNKAKPVNTNFEITDTDLVIGNCHLERFTNFQISLSPNLTLTHKLLSIGEYFLQAITKSWMVMLVGPSGTGKTSFVKAIAALGCRKLNILNVNSNMDTIELLGGFEQSDMWHLLYEILEDIKKEFYNFVSQCFLNGTTNHLSQLFELFSNLNLHFENKNFNGVICLFKQIINAIDTSNSHNVLERLENLTGKNVGGKFDWIDSCLINSMKNGDWLLIQGANVCSPSVLDRLNCLLEPNGVLCVTERGVINGELITIKPHPEFRLILELDPKFGELSRAMRNRGLEIWTGFNWSDHDLKILCATNGVKEKYNINIILNYFKKFGKDQTHYLIRSAKLFDQTMRILGFDCQKATNVAITETYLIDKEKMIGADCDRLNMKQTKEVFYFSEPRISSFQRNVDLANTRRFSSTLMDYLQNDNCVFIHTFTLFFLAITDCSNTELVQKWMLEKFSKHEKIIKIIFQAKITYIDRENLFFYSLLSCLQLEINETTLIKSSKLLTQRFNDQFHSSILHLDEFVDMLFQFIQLQVSNLEDFEILRRLSQFKIFCDKNACITKTAEYELELILHLNWIKNKLLKKFFQNIPAKFTNLIEKLEDSIQNYLKIENCYDKILYNQLIGKCKGIPFSKKHIFNEINMMLKNENRFNDNWRKQIIEMSNCLFSKNDLIECNKILLDSDKIQTPIRSTTNDILELSSCQHLIQLICHIFENKIDEKKWYESIFIGLGTVVNLKNVLQVINYQNSYDLFLPCLTNRLNDCFQSTSTLHTCREIQLAFTMFQNKISLNNYLDCYKDLRNVSEVLFSSSLRVKNVTYCLEKILSNLIIRVLNVFQVSVDPMSTITIVWNQLKLKLLSLKNQIDISFLNYQLNWSQEFDNSLLYISEISVKLGLIYINLFYPRSSVDPEFKKRVKQDLLEKEINNINEELKAYSSYLFNLIGVEENEISLNKKRKTYLGNRRNTIMKKLLPKGGEIFRENFNDYNKLVKQISLFLSTTYMQPEFIINLYKNIAISTDDNNKKQAMIEFDSLRKSLIEFSKLLTKDFSLYNDCIGGFLNGISLVIYGFDLLKQESVYNKIQDIVGDIHSFPISIYSSFNKWFNHDNLKCLKNSIPNKSSNELSWILGELLLEDENAVNISSNSSNKSFNVLNKLITIWKKQDEIERQKKLEEESLFKIKEHGEKLTEDEKDEKEIKLLFPEFSFDYPVNLPSKDAMFNINDDCLENIFKLISYSPNNEQNHVTIWQNSFLKRFDLLYEILQITQFKEKYSKQLSYYFSYKEYLTRNSIDDNQSFYNGKNISMAKNCLPILHNLQNTVNQRLSEWSEHPTLLKINSVIVKVLQLPIDSPPVRYATGLQMILQECEEWEKNSSKRLKLIDDIVEVNKLLKEFRKLELRNWNIILESEFQIARKRCYKSAMGLLAAIEEQNDNENFEEVLNLIKKWIETSKLGDFRERLYILEIFYGFCLCKNPKLATYLSNLKNNYLVFIDNIDERLSSGRKPIEKELKGFIKISRWNDKTFWALQSDVLKAQRHVFKSVKKYRSLLDEPINLILKDDVEFSSNAFNCQYSLGNLEIELAEKTDPSFSKFNDIVRKASKHSDFILNTTLKFSNVENNNEIRLSIIDAFKRFQNTNIPNDLSKEERKKLIKRLQYQKRQCLLTFLTDLKQQGLSYRKGCKEVNQDETLQLDIFNITNQLNKIDPTDLPFKKIWNELKDNHSRCVSRRMQVFKAFETPSKELTMAELQKIKGFSLHFSAIERLNFSRLGECYLVYTRFNKLLMAFKKMINEGWIIDWQKSAAQFSNLVTGKIKIALVSLSQFYALFQTSPFDIINEKCSIFLENFISIDDCSSSAINDISKQIEKCINTLQTIHKQQFLSNEIIFYSKIDLQRLQKTKCEFNEIQENLKKVGISLGLKRELKNALSDCLWSAIDSLIINEDSLELINPRLDIKNLEEEKEKLLIENCLLAIQRVRKLSLNYENKKDLKAFEDDGLFNLFLALHLDTMSNNLMDIDKLNTETSTLLFNLLLKYTHLVRNILLKFSENCLTLSKLTSSTLLVAIKLATAGFCTPADLIENNQDNSGQDMSITETEDCAGMAGNEKGKKDVSEQIEDEEQVEGRKGDEDESDDEDVKGEDNAIEMSNDFEGESLNPHIEDVDDDESNEETEDENDIDKEMGDVGDEGEKLDERLWGSDEDDEDNETQKDQHEEDGGGEVEKGESKLVANDDVCNADDAKPLDEEQNENEDNLDQNEEIHQQDPYDDRNFDEKETNNHEKSKINDNEIEDLPENMEKESDEDNDLSNESENNDVENSEEINPFDIDNILNKEEKIEESNNNNDEDIEMTNDDNSEGEVNHDDNDDTNKKDNDFDDMEDEEMQDNDTFQNNPETNSKSYDNNPIQSDIKVGHAESNEMEQDVEKSGSGAKDDNCGMNVPLGKQQQMFSETTTSDCDKKGKNRNALNIERTIADKVEDDKFIENLETTDQNENDQNSEMNETATNKDLFEHTKNDETHDKITVDSATSEQQCQDDKNWVTETEENTIEKEDEKMDLVNEVKELESKKLQSDGKRKEANDQKNAEQNNKEVTNKKNIDGDIVLTDTVRDIQTFSSINYDVFNEMHNSHTVVELRNELENQLNDWRNKIHDDKFDRTCLDKWRRYEMLTSELSRQLCEQLRLVLEPTKVNRLQGDYRTGKRLNMRKVIAYVASDFRKDKIWLRRSRASDRDYRVLLAIDDSRSMSSNKCVQVAYEAVAVLSNALKLLEIGKLGLLSYGGNVKLLHDPDEPWSTESGAKVLKMLNFEQKQTNISDLLEYCCALMANIPNSNTTKHLHQLLIIVSDGRGMFSGGIEKVKTAVRKARQFGLFIVFVIVDHPDSPTPIMQVRIPIIEKDKPTKLVSYMEYFPFPFYLVLREVEALPSTLGDALRQWLEIVSSQN